MWDDWARERGARVDDHSVTGDLDMLADEIRGYLKKFHEAELEKAKEGILKRSDITGYIPFRFDNFAVSANVRTISIRYTWGRYYSINKEQAQDYVRWLRAGNVGTHWDCPDACKRGR